MMPAPDAQPDKAGPLRLVRRPQASRPGGDAELLAPPGPLPVGRYRLHWVTEAPIVFQDYAGSALRGVFGHALKRLVCVTGQSDCRICPQYRQCRFPALFEPPPPHDERRRYSAIAAPFVIEAPDAMTREVGEAWSFDLVLLGPAREALPLLLLAWQQALQRGIGQPAGRAKLVGLTHREQTLLDARSQWVPRAGLDPLAALPMWRAPHAPTVQLEFLTPLRIKRAGELLRAERLQAPDLLMGILRRCAEVCELHLGTRLQADFAGLKLAAQSVTMRHGLQWRDWQRYSNRQATHMPLGGLVGPVELAGEGLRHFWPLLHLAQLLHVGGKTTFGLGHYRILNLEDAP